MHNPAPVLENYSHKPHWDFDLHTDHLISARRPDLIIINKIKKKFAKLSTLLSLLNHRIKLNECEKKDKFLDIARELEKKPWKHAGDNDTNCNWFFWFSN